MFIRITSLCALLACSVPSFASEYTIGELLIEHPWSRELPVDLPGGAAYFTVHNQGNQADRLVGVSSPRAQTSALHSRPAEDGMMTMLHTPSVDIPAHGEVMFKPGANHVMLTGMAQPLRAGEQFPLTLEFEKAGKVEVNVTVRAADALTGNDPHSGH